MRMDPRKREYKTPWMSVQRIFFICSIFLILQPGIVEAIIPIEPPAQNLPLTAGESIEKEISADLKHSYRFELSDKLFLRIDFYSPNTDLLVSIALPGDTESLEWNIVKRGTVPIASVLDTKGTYRLQVQSLGKNVRSGSYRMEVRSARSTRSQDHRQIDASRHLSNAARYRCQWTKATLKSAIREYEKAVRLWGDTGDPEQEAITLKHAGDVWEIFAEWKQALSCYEKAQEIYSRLGDFGGEIEVINAIGFLYINRGEYQKALDLYTLDHRTIEDTWQKAKRLHNFGAAFWGMTEMPKAIDFLNQALELQKQLQDLPAQADTLLYLGYVNHAVKDITAAEQYYVKSHDLCMQTESPRGRALALTALGNLSNDSGENQRAMEYYDQSLKIFETIGELSGRSLVLMGKGHVYEDLGENDKALQKFQTALDLVKQVGDRALEADILGYIGAIYRDLGFLKKALQYSEQAVEVNRSLPSPQAEAYALSNLAKTQQALGKQEAAEVSYSRGLGLSKQANDRFLEGYFLNALGQINHGSGNLQKALGYYRQALSLQLEANDSVGMPGTLYNLSRAERDLGDLESAMEHAGQALEITESLRTKVASPELRGSYLASVHQQYELLINLLMQKHRRQPAGQFDAEALKISEQARARSLLDMLAEAQTDIREGVDPGLLTQERSLEKQLNTKAEMHMQLLKREHSKEEGEALNQEIEAILVEHQEIQARIRSRSPHYAALTQPQPLSLPKIQQTVLDEEALLLEYKLGEEQSHVWAVTPTTIHSYYLPKRTEIEKRVNRVHELMLERQKSVEETGRQYGQRIKKADTEYRKEAADLSRILLGPVSDQLAYRRLLVVPDGILQYLPFGALPEPHSMKDDSSNKPQPLIMEHEIVYLPSASVLGLIRQETGERPLPAKKIVVLADPVFEANDPRIRTKVATMKQTETAPPESIMDPAPSLESIVRERGGEFLRLPGTRHEADSILSLVPTGSSRKLLGFDANRTVASGPELGQYQVVHFGTHGFIDHHNPELSGLVLSLFNEQGHPQDGYLRLHDIYNLKLPVELVVLSACDSALGKEVRGEGLVGIVRGFMYAGAKRIMASLWKVDDRPTAELMKRFYRHLLQDGVTPARALQMAQREMWNQQRWRAPYYWAAFILQGEWN